MMKSLLKGLLSIYYNKRQRDLAADRQTPVVMTLKEGFALQRDPRLESAACRQERDHQASAPQTSEGLEFHFCQTLWISPS